MKDRPGWDYFYPMAQLLSRKMHTIPWCLNYEFDAVEFGYWVKFDPTFKNTIIDPRDKLT